MLERFGHGGDLMTASELFGYSQDSFLDYSSNMNPAGPPACVKNIFLEEWPDIHRYPDPNSRALRKQISKFYDVPEDAVLIGNGAAELIDLVVRTIRPSTVAVTAPSFGEYSENANRVGAQLHFIPLNRKHSFDVQLHDLSVAQRAADLLILGHPNNPTGRLLHPSILNQLSTTNGMVMLDEAFVDFLENEEEVSMIKKAPFSEYLIVVRSMTKFFAIPGIRLGFLVAHPALINRIRHLQVHWSVNHFAQRIGEEVLKDQTYISKTKKWVSTERKWFSEKLVQIGFDVVESSVNYLLVKLPDKVLFDVRELQRRLGNQQILIRDASLFFGLNERYFRLAVRLRTDNEKILHVLDTLLTDSTQLGG